ncbi:TRAF3-interacting protein 1 [Camelus dromedarius]|uniref:TRAF3-interacting protein 1 n=1 Tax=Camelus dromedarius TaxID=9838 RepID=A0A5N4E869_CAMDR|nr:TRAF3-interacting protein 1 [Camelus dromedarius]
MNAAVVKRTQEALGKVIRKPPLTEKLLNKPPFRYLHDIITEVIRTTGFMKGLYTDAEMKSDNVKDKDAKISFLQKAIDVVVMVSGEPLSAKPARIVAGHEPERTNELLQRIGKCCLGKLSSDDAVKRVLAREKGDTKRRPSLTSKPQELDNKNAREEEPRVHKDKEDRRNSEVNERSTSREGKQKEEVGGESKPRERDRDKEKARESDRERQREPERDKIREGERERAKTRARPERDRDRGNRDRDKDADRERERKNEAGREKERWKDRERERERDKGRDRDRDRDRDQRRVRNGEHARDPDREKSHEHEKPEKKSSSAGEMSKKLSDGSFKDSKVEPEVNFIILREVAGIVTGVHGDREERVRKKEDNIATKILDSIVSGLSNEPDQEATASEIGDSPSDAGKGDFKCLLAVCFFLCKLLIGPSLVQKEKLDLLARRIVRGWRARSQPASSRLRPGPCALILRPAPLCARLSLRDARAFFLFRAGSGKTVSNVIIDSQNSDNEDDDQFVVEAVPQLSEMSEPETVQAVELEEDEKHGAEGAAGAQDPVVSCEQLCG